MMHEFSVTPLAENAALVQWNDLPLPELHRQLMGLYHRLRSDPFPGFLEAVPAYDSLAVFYDPLQIPGHGGSPTKRAFECIRKQRIQPEKSTDLNSTLHTIPVRYGGNDGPDLITLADENKLTPDELIGLHTEKIYDVYMLGFTGAFPYLGFTDAKLSARRKSIPRQDVPAGSVALAGNQTGIYPFQGPGAWQIIGRTGIGIFNKDNEDPVLIKPGDKVQFVRE